MPEAGMPVSLTIFAITVGISLYGLFANNGLVNAFMLRPYEVIRESKWWQLITSGLVHGDLGHLFFNMLTFFFFAFPLEGVLGSANFFLLYMICLIVSDIPTLIRYRHDDSYASLGASGAISGVVFGSILFNPLGKIYIMMMIPVPAFLYGVLYLAYCWYASRHAQDNINHDAHFWGALAGLAVTLIMEPLAGRVFLYSFGIG